MANPQQSMQPAPLQIQGGATKERVIPSFKKTVVDVDPTEWGNLPDTDKADVGNEFFKTHYESDPDWASLAPEDQDEVRQTFYKNNQLPSQQDTNFFGDLANHTLNAATGYTQDDLLKQSGQGVGSFIGDALGGLGYAGGGTLAGGALGSVVPVVGNVAGAIGGGIAGAATGGTLQDLQSQRIEGQQNPNYGRALGSGAIQGALQAIPVVGQGAKLLPRALANAGIQGAGGAVGSYGQQALEQGTFTPNVDIERLKREAAFGAGGGTVGAVLHSEPKVKPTGPQVRGFDPDLKTPVGYRVNKQKVVSPKEYRQIGTARQSANDVIENIRNIRNTQKLTSEGTLSSKVSQYDNLYNKLNQEAGNKDNNPYQQSAYKKLAGYVQKEAAPIQETVKTGKAKKAESTKAARKQEFTDRENVKLNNKLTTLEAQIAGRERVLKSKTASDVQKAQASKELASHKAQLTAAIKEQEYRNKEALQSKKPAPKQRGQAAKNAAPEQAKPGGRTTLYPSKKAGKVESVVKEKNLPGLEAVKDHPEVKRRPDLMKKLNQAYKNGEIVKPKYQAEKFGTEIDKMPSEGVTPVAIKQNKDKSISVSVIDGEGQPRAYKLFDGKGDSLLDDVTLTGKASKFEPVRDLEDLLGSGEGRYRVKDTKTNELVEIFKPGEQRKSSEIAADREKIIDVAERLKAGEKVSTRDIVEAAKKVDQSTFKQQFENLSQEQINEIGKDLGC